MFKHHKKLAYLHLISSLLFVGIADIHAAAITVNSSSELFGCNFRRAVDTINAGNDLNNGCSPQGTFGDNDEINFSVESVSLLNGPIVLSKPVKINSGSSSRVAFSRLQNTARPDANFVEMFIITSDGVEIDNFSIQNISLGDNAFAAVTVVANSSAVFRNCDLSENFLGGFPNDAPTSTSLVSVQGSQSKLTLDNCDINQNVSVVSSPYRVLQALDGASLTIINSRITENEIEAATQEPSSGIFTESDLINRSAMILAHKSRLVITDSLVSENKIAIRLGTLTLDAGLIIGSIEPQFTRIENTTVSNNLNGNEEDSRVAPRWGAIVIYSFNAPSQAEVIDSRVISNVPHGIHAKNVNLLVSRTSIANNERIGLLTRSDNRLASKTTVVGSTLRGNGSRFFGGAIDARTFREFDASDQSTLELDVVNTTISSNDSAVSFNALSNSTDLSALRIYNSTIVNNPRSAGLSSSSSSLVVINARVELLNNIISGNGQEGSISQLTIRNAIDVNNDFNVIGDNRSIIERQISGFIPGPNSIVASSNGNQPSSINAIIRPLANNGGGMQTHALANNSPAIDSAALLVCALIAEGVDQIGAPRNKGNGCDIGAMEFFENESCYVIKTKQDKVVTFCL